MVDLGKIPKLQKSYLTEVISLRVDAVTKRDLDQLEYQYEYDTSTWLREVIRREIDLIKQARETTT